MRKLGKRGSALTDNLIWIILGLLLLVILLYFFVPGFQKIIKSTFGFAVNNVDAATQSCNIQCSTLQKNAFCCTVVEVILDDKGAKLTGTCELLRSSLSGINCPADFCPADICPKVP